jgi:hypothetical protein
MFIAQPAREDERASLQLHVNVAVLPNVAVPPRAEACHATPCSAGSSPKVRERGSVPKCSLPPKVPLYHNGTGMYATRPLQAVIFERETNESRPNR